MGGVNCNVDGVNRSMDGVNRSVGKVWVLPTVVKTTRWGDIDASPSYNSMFIALTIGSCTIEQLCPVPFHAMDVVDARNLDPIFSARQSFSECIIGFS